MDDVVLALLDDAGAGAAACIECAAALARAVRRPLALVQVENPMALHAAALPHTRALAHAAAGWQPFEPEDVERGWRAQAARLRTLAVAIAERQAVSWSLRSMRSSAPHAARELSARADLLLVGAAVRRPRGGSVLLVDDGGPACARVLPLAHELAQALGVPLQIRPWRDGDDDTTLRAQARRATLCLLPRDLALPGWVHEPPCPLLLVASP